ncbi:hypothetical protein EIJ81_00435 (plasmid) [Aliivibrio salmonicida]|uniref:hypothetical protein n=1 Tax=Aliivibrio salmonicida TaxID=40269 RepID=UPI000F6C0E04|nr:hypothetical protein [Aliivibrio salmonicida]AZL83366.1 hypothetical protein EIJ81_00435 [Aliivibrio salmonicida]
MKNVVTDLTGLSKHTHPLCHKLGYHPAALYQSSKFMPFRYSNDLKNIVESGVYMFGTNGQEIRELKANFPKIMFGSKPITNAKRMVSSIYKGFEFNKFNFKAIEERPTAVFSVSEAKTLTLLFQLIGGSAMIQLLSISLPLKSIEKDLLKIKINGMKDKESLNAITNAISEYYCVSEDEYLPEVRLERKNEIISLIFAELDKSDGRFNYVFDSLISLPNHQYNLIFWGMFLACIKIFNDVNEEFSPSLNGKLNHHELPDLEHALILFSVIGNLKPLIEIGLSVKAFKISDLRLYFDVTNIDFEGYENVEAMGLLEKNAWFTKFNEKTLKIRKFLSFNVLKQVYLSNCLNRSNYREGFLYSMQRSGFDSFDSFDKLTSDDNKKSTLLSFFSNHHSLTNAEKYSYLASSAVEKKQWDPSYFSKVKPIYFNKSNDPIELFKTMPDCIQSDLYHQLFIAVFETLEAMSKDIYKYPGGYSNMIALTCYLNDALLLVFVIDKERRACLESLNELMKKPLENALQISDIALTLNDNVSSLENDIHISEFRNSLKQQAQNSKITEQWRTASNNRLIQSFNAMYPSVTSEPSELVDLTSKVSKLENELEISKQDLLSAKNEYAENVTKCKAETEMKVECIIRDNYTNHPLTLLANSSSDMKWLSLLSILDMIKANFSNVIILDAAYESSKSASSFRLKDVLKDLVVLCTSYIPSIKNRGDQVVNELFTTDRFKANESESTMNNAKLRKMREVEYDGNVFYMEKHLGFGSDKSTSIRIYFEVVNDKIIIGYAGPHLECSNSG